MAGEGARGADVYVTLEPCSHYGKTPPCAEALIAAQVARAVVACGDPDKRVSGRGLAMLRTAGIEVVENVLREEAEHLNAGFLKCIRESLPLVTLKLATTLDGKIATSTGESRWITGPAARRYGHFLRAAHDAILVGRGTAEADDPSLTCRFPGLEERSPVRVVLDSHGRLPASLKLFADGAAPTWHLTAERLGQMAGARIDPRRALSHLAARGITRVLVEGGGELSASLLKADTVDRIAWFRAPSLIGTDGRAGVAELGVQRMADLQCFRLTGSRQLGRDRLETYERAGWRSMSPSQSAARAIR